MRDATSSAPQPLAIYPDGRAPVYFRLGATDQGRLFEHGQGPDKCDSLGAREVNVILHNGEYHMFYDGAEADVGWLSCLATSPDLKSWRRHGKMFSYGQPGTPDSHTATSPWFIHHDGLWHAFYVGCRRTSRPPNCIPTGPYLTVKAEAEQLTGPWRKRYDVHVVDTEPGTYHSTCASPGYIFCYGGKFWMFFSCGVDRENAQGKRLHMRTLGLAYAPHPDGPWTLLDAPVLPHDEQIENSSLYYEEANGWWFLFTNHVGVDEKGHEWTDAIWVYWSKDPTQWTSKNKAIALDGKNCTWSDRCIGMPSALKVADRLAIFYDAPGDDSISHMGRDIGLAWYKLPLFPPTENTAEQGAPTDANRPRH